jgi:GT2 family glycosyltransferase
VPSKVHAVSAIVATIGRPESLTRLLASLARQTRPLFEVVIADGSSDGGVAAVVSDPRWAASGLCLKRIAVQPPHAVRQRIAAIEASSGEFILFLDDDVELEDDCVHQLVDTLERTPGAVAVGSDFSNQTWPEPPLAWRIYLKYVLGLEQGEWQGRVVGPLLRFGYNPSPSDVAPMGWLNTGGTLVRREAYDACGGFSDFFLHRATINEDVDLSLKLSRIGRLLLNPRARIAHYHAPGGRLSTAAAAEDDLYNRYLILRETVGTGERKAFRLVCLFIAVETASNAIGGLLRLRWPGFAQRTLGRLRGLRRVERARD